MTDTIRFVTSSTWAWRTSDFDEFEGKTLADCPHDIGTPDHTRWIHQWSDHQSIAEQMRRTSAGRPLPTVGRGIFDDVHPMFRERDPETRS